MEDSKAAIDLYAQQCNLITLHGSDVELVMVLSGAVALHCMIHEGMCVYAC